jgi:rhamnogalacturonyl hydrolase YesR
MDAAARLLTTYAARLQQPSGLFNHAVNGPAAWGRGNGFAALGLAETLTRIPAAHAARPQLIDIFRRQMAAVRANQAPDGAWRQVIDAPGAYREETATAMLLAAMARGIRLGWLDASYRPTVDRAWRALAAHIVEDGTLIDVCSGTGAGPTRRYYFDRPAVSGADDRGGAMGLLAALEVYELRGAGKK